MTQYLTATIIHIDTGAGPRFSWGFNDAEVTAELLEYNNNTLNGDDEDEQLDDGACLEEIVDKIDERERVSMEELSIPLPADLYKLAGPERDTVLAALRFWQREGHEANFDEWTISNNGGTVTPLDASAIDDLCERINLN